MFPPGKYSETFSKNAHSIIAFKIPRDQLGMRNLLLQEFPTCWQDMMVAYQKVIVKVEQPGAYVRRLVRLLQSRKI